jgi:hypothetical protein
MDRWSAEEHCDRLDWYSFAPCRCNHIRTRCIYIFHYRCSRLIYALNDNTSD